MVELKIRRQQNNMVRIPDALWNWINAKEGEFCIFKDEEGKKGRYVSFWKDEDEE